jgi:hypothetical protein
LEDLGLRNIAVLGASSSMFQALLAQPEFVQPGDVLHLYSRTRILTSTPTSVPKIATYDLSEFVDSRLEFDEIHNFIGTGDPRIFPDELRKLSVVSLHWDSVATNMLRYGQAGKYFSISSGVASDLYESLEVNLYRDLKVELEKRHESASLPTVDIRVFGFADSKSKFFRGSLVGDIRAAMTNQTPMITDASDPIRDYCGAQELASLIAAIRMNDDAFGVSELHSLKPVSKSELLSFLSSSGIISISKSTGTLHTSTGSKPTYVPNDNNNLWGYKPTRDSLQVVCSALELVN